MILSVLGMNSSCLAIGGTNDIMADDDLGSFFSEIQEIEHKIGGGDIPNVDEPPPPPLPAKVFGYNFLLLSESSHP